MKVLKVRDVKTPTRGTSLSAGIDFYVPNDFKKCILKPHEDILIPSGIKANFDHRLMLMAAEKSGVTSSFIAKCRCSMEPKQDCFKSPSVLGAKIVDSDYQGEIHIHIINVGKEDIPIEPGKKIAQFILVPVVYDTIEEVDSENKLYNGLITERGEGGFGSTNN